MSIDHQAIDDQPEIDDRGFDPAALRAKCRAERDKRLQADGNEQYVEMAGKFAHYLDDPSVETPIDRAPVAEEVGVLVIGRGFGGLLAGARLRDAGADDVRLIEKGGEFGGTRYWNRYPGAACDIESYVYLPLLEETGFMPERTDEILGPVLDRRKFFEECIPGYYDGEGKTNPLAASYAYYGEGSNAFFKVLADWRADGAMQRFVLK